MANPSNPGDMIADWNEAHGVAGVQFGSKSLTNDEIREVFHHSRTGGEEKMRLYAEALISQGAKLKRPKGKRVYTLLRWEWRKGMGKMVHFTVIARTDLGNETTLSYPDIKRNMIRVG